jgi:integrase/recombinase XerD
MEQNNEETFQKHLMLKDLSEKTITLYLIYYRLFPHSKDLTQELINQFLIKHKGNVVRAFVLNYLEYLKRDDIEIIKRTGRKKVRIRKALPISEINSLATYFYKKNSKHGLMFEIMWELALRREEIATLKASWFDWDTWEKDMEKPCRIYVLGKNDKERPLIVSPKLMKKVYNFINRQLKEKNFKLNKRLFGMGEHTIWEVFVKYSEKVLGKRCTPHEIRHSRATYWRDSGLPIEEIQRRLGHESIQTTLIYLHVDEERMLKSWESEFS